MLVPMAGKNAGFAESDPVSCLKGYYRVRGSMNRFLLSIFMAGLLASCRDEPQLFEPDVTTVSNLELHGTAKEAATEKAFGFVEEVVKAEVGKLLPGGEVQIHCQARTDGPIEHVKNGFDQKISAPVSRVHNWKDMPAVINFDVQTARVFGDNHNGPPHENDHEAFIELHYVRADDAWGPRQPDPFGGVADAKKDEAPFRNKVTTTTARAVCIFSVAGPLGGDLRFEVDGPNRNVTVPKPRRSRSLNGQLSGEDRQSIGAEAQATVLFETGGSETGRFIFEPVGEDFVRVSPIGGPLTIDLIHFSAMLAPKRAFFLPPFSGQSPGMKQLVSDLAGDFVASNDFLRLPPNANARVDLTIEGAALLLGSGIFARFDRGGEKTHMELLREYFANPIAVQVVPPSHAQLGYVPQVTCRELVVGGTSFGCAGISDELRETIEALPPDVRPSIGLRIAVKGSLADAVNLAAHTPGTAIAQIVEDVPTGELFELPMTISASSGGNVEDIEVVKHHLP